MQCLFRLNTVRELQYQVHALVRRWINIPVQNDKPSCFAFTVDRERRFLWQVAYLDCTFVWKHRTVEVDCASTADEDLACRRRTRQFGEEHPAIKLEKRPVSSTAHRILLAAALVAALGGLGWPHVVTHDDVRRLLSAFDVRPSQRHRLFLATSFFNIDEADTAHGSEPVRVVSTAQEAAKTGGFAGAGVVAHGGGANG